VRAVNELDQDEEVGGNQAGSATLNERRSKAKLKPLPPEPPLSEEAVKRKEGALPLREGDPEKIGEYKVVGRDPDDGELLVEFPEREPIVAMSMIKCPCCHERMYVSTSQGRLETRSYTACFNDNCHHFVNTGKRKRGSVERQLTTNIKRFDEIGIERGRREKD
jgi:hypothetical protein